MTPLDRRLTTTQRLAEAWRFVDGGHGYSAPQLFVLLLDRRDRPLPELVQLYDHETDGVPDDVLLDRLLGRLTEKIDAEAPGGSIALMKARPGSATLTDLDRRWFRALHDHLSAASVGSKPLFFATDTVVLQVPPDELVARVG